MEYYKTKKFVYKQAQFSGIGIDWILPKYGGFIRTIIVPETTILAASDNTHLSHNGVKEYAKLYQNVIRPTLEKEYYVHCIFSELKPEQVKLFEIITGKKAVPVKEMGKTALYAEFYEELN